MGAFSRLPGSKTDFGTLNNRSQVSLADRVWASFTGPMPSLTLEHIAELSGVSRSPVSRVINNQKRVSAEVRARVLKVIAETGYQPDQTARSLARRRSYVKQARPA